MAKAKAAPKRKAANGYKLAEPLPLGEILKDITKKEWKLGPSIGRGGFGEIYSAKESTSKGSQYPYVIKIEPHANGPLFVEMHFYMRNAKLEDVEAFKKKKGLKTFGMPLYLGSGSHEYNGEKYRFIAMEKFGSDFWKIFLENNRTFSTTTVFKIAVQILDVLEYIHCKGYVHADIKAANILMGITKETQNKQCYLVDFGLATKWNDNVDFKPNPKKAHDGTIEYLSRDAHLGVQTRRGDLEILAYNLIQWLGCVLPWEKNLSDPSIVQKSKEEHMSSIPKFMKSCFIKKSPPGSLVEFLKYLSTLKHNTSPNYEKIRKIFIAGLDSIESLQKPFNFSLKAKSLSKNTSSKSPLRKTPVKRKNNNTPSSTPRPKNLRQKEAVSESSEDEKENLDEDDDEMISSTEDTISPKGRQRRINYADDSVDEKIVKESKKTFKKPAVTKDNQAKAKKTSTKSPLRKRKSNNTPSSTPRTKNLKQKDAVSESSEDEKENLDEDDDEMNSSTEEIISPRGRQRRINYTEDSADIEIEKPKKRTFRKPAVSKDNQAKDNMVNLNGYTDAMKEVFQKKASKEKLKRRNKTAKPVIDDNMEGFTASMKEIALKKMERLAKKGSN